MFIKFEYNKTTHQRPSKNGKIHTYIRQKTIAVLRCDSCNELFKRDRGNMDPKRLNNNYFHVCNSCDVKRFAQKKGIEKKAIWDMPASRLDDISKL